MSKSKRIYRVQEATLTPRGVFNARNPLPEIECVAYTADVAVGQAVDLTSTDSYYQPDFMLRAPRPTAPGALRIVAGFFGTGPGSLAHDRKWGTDA